MVSNSVPLASMKVIGRQFEKGTICKGSATINVESATKALGTRVEQEERQNEVQPQLSQSKTIKFQCVKKLKQEFATKVAMWKKNCQLRQFTTESI